MSKDPAPAADHHPVSQVHRTAVLSASRTELTPAALPIGLLARGEAGGHCRAVLYTPPSLVPEGDNKKIPAGRIKVGIRLRSPGRGRLGGAKGILVAPTTAVQPRPGPRPSLVYSADTGTNYGTSAKLGVEADPVTVDLPEFPPFGVHRLRFTGGRQVSAASMLTAW